MTLDEFLDKYLGKQVEYHSFGGDGTYNQCVDLANAYIDYVLGLTPIIGTNAKDFKDKYSKDEFQWIPNDPNNDLFPKRGDLVVFNGRVGGGAGHISIALDNASLDHLRTLDQNWSKKEVVTIEKHKYNNVSGWLRPKEKNMADDALKACLEDREKFWKERDKAQEDLAKASEEVAKLKERISQERKAKETELENQKNEMSQQCDIRVQEAREKLIKSYEDQISKLSGDSAKNKNDILMRFTSRKFIVALLALLLPIGNKYLELNMNAADILATLTPIMAFIGFEGWTDHKVRMMR